LTNSHFTGFGGLVLEAECYGSENDPAVILLHGGAQDKSVWRSAAAALALAGRHVICLDLRGHGESGWASDGRYDLDAHVADLRAVLATLDSRPVIVGASLGGWIAIAALGEDGAHLSTGLVLVESPPRIEETELRRVRASMRNLTDTKDPKWDPRILEEYPADALEPRLSAAASQITVPTLVIRGARSTLTSSAAAQGLARLIRNVECVEIEGAGRQVAFAQADAFNAFSGAQGAAGCARIPGWLRRPHATRRAGVLRYGCYDRHRAGRLRKADWLDGQLVHLRLTRSTAAARVPRAHDQQSAHHASLQGCRRQFNFGLGRLDAANLCNEIS
jgi:pimeloyl-ACP methyl ester carboxylesterase